MIREYASVCSYNIYNCYTRGNFYDDECLRSSYQQKVQEYANQFELKTHDKIDRCRILSKIPYEEQNIWTSKGNKDEF